MAQLVALESETHGTLKHRPDSGLIYAKSAHMVPLRVTEVAQATVDFPVLISRTSTGDMSLSALTSFETGENRFLVNGYWTSSFTPSAMRTYPLYLMQPEKSHYEPRIGFDPDSNGLGSDGEALFDKRGKPSLYLKQLKVQLIEDSNNLVHTFRFFEKLKAYDLMRSVDLILNYADGETNRIRGLSMINEDSLQTLAPEKLTDLRDLGYLAPIYAMLFSVFQLNALIRRTNEIKGVRIIKNLNLEVSKQNRPV